MTRHIPHLLILFPVVTNESTSAAIGFQWTLDDGYFPARGLSYFLARGFLHITQVPVRVIAVIH